MSCVQENNFKYKHIGRLNVKDWEKIHHATLVKAGMTGLPEKNYISE